MKKLLVLLFSLILTVSVFGQDRITIAHTNYTTTFSKTLHYPLKVEWWLTKQKVGCPNPLPRKDQFQSDPKAVSDTNLDANYILANKLHKAKQLPTFDRGHMCPAAENECNGPAILTECFYFSNMTPQYHSLNAGDWKTLEVLERKLALGNDSIHIWAGSIGSVEKFGILNIPAKCWKVIYIKKTKEYQAYLFTNNTTNPVGLRAHKVDKSVIQKLTGFVF